MPEGDWSISGAGIYCELVEDYVWVDWPNSMHREFQLDWAIDLNEPLPVANEEFDTVLLTDVLEHIARPDHLFAEMVDPPEWWTPLISSFGSRKVFDGYIASSMHG